jgi:hypothetical protein
VLEKLPAICQEPCGCRRIEIGPRRQSHPRHVLET